MRHLTLHARRQRIVFDTKLLWAKKIVVFSCYDYFFFFFWTRSRWWWLDKISGRYRHDDVVTSVSLTAQLYFSTRVYTPFCLSCSGVYKSELFGLRRLMKIYHIIPKEPQVDCVFSLRRVILQTINVFREPIRSHSDKRVNVFFFYFLSGNIIGIPRRANVINNDKN